MVSFSILLISVIYWVVAFSYQEQDTILDAHEYYYYSKMVSSWEIPPDTIKIKEDLINLKMMCIIHTDSSFFWNYPKDFFPERLDYTSFSDSEFLGEMYDIDISRYVSFGEIGSYTAAYIDNEPYHYYLAIDYTPKSDLWIRFFPAAIMNLVFMIILYLVFRRYLKPVYLMRKRVTALEKGDLDSEIPIIGEDELASLSKTINRMIAEIRDLLEKKQLLLSDISHELRSPLARMRLLSEMLPEHKNTQKLKIEIAFIDDIISNILLSDKLSTPYSNLELVEINIDNLLAKVVAMFPNSQNNILITGKPLDLTIHLDETKIRLALRNLIDNALKYGGKNQPVEISILTSEKYLEISVKDFGKGVSKYDIKKITEPFYRREIHKDKKIRGFGLGLSITKKITEAHGGMLKIESKQGEWSVFTLCFPTTPLSI
ncbi:MAG: HAMP domain-containing histidine kinase [Candidatus Marinimicrobia bacterium]|nr:HAMP domain-containing histidine kinase [Candidatus Neomarinimicrobiota bacterium]